jgi:long-chain fatty acid transport protein
MLRDLKWAILMALTTLAGSHASALAGGLYLNEFATPSMGTAGAGQEAYANDASTNFAFHNPAGMTRLEGNQVSLGAGLLVGDTQFDPDPSTPFGGGSGGSQAGLAPLLGSHGVYSVNEDLKLGMSVFSITGAALDPNDGWSGRFQMQKISLLTVTANPNVAYRVNKVLSLGAGVMAMYADIDYKLAAPPGGVGRVKLDGNDWAYGYNAGALIELGPGTRFGVTYVSKIEPDFSGDLEINSAGGPPITTDSNLKLTFPQTVRVAAYHELNDQWALLGTVGWEDWSEFDELLVSTSGGTASVPTEWRDTYHFSGGVHYRPVQDWLLQAGITYDTSPVSDANRTADLPMDRQIRYAIGAQHQWSEQLAFGGSFEYIDLGDAKIDNPSVLVGEYETNRVFAFALNMSYKF